MAEGLSTEEMARRLFVAQVTVRTHVAAILRKLRVKDRQSAVRLFRGVPTVRTRTRSAEDDDGWPYQFDRPGLTTTAGC
jgi:Bacterial regulatory proteins, luxR family